MEKQVFDRARALANLVKIGHGNLSLYELDALPVAKEDPELFAHLVAWNAINGKVKDSQVALPPIALRGLVIPVNEFAENAVGHMALLGPRELVRSYQFSKYLSRKGLNIPNGYRRMLEKALKRYIQVREENPAWWNGAVVRNRKAMVELYTISHIKPAPFAQAILFDHKYPAGSIFEAIAHLKTMPPLEAAGTIVRFKIPMPIAVGAVAQAKNPDILLALLEQMSGNEFLNSQEMLKRLGVHESPALKATYEAAWTRALGDQRVHALKGGRVAQAMLATPTGLSEDIAQKALQVQEARLSKLGGIEGDWLVLGDRSGSMAVAIEVARQVAALIAQQVKGKVYLVFFNTEPRLIDVTGKTLDEIHKLTQHIMPLGGTSIGCGLDYLRARSIAVNGIAVASDGLDNTHPLFGQAYAQYESAMSLSPTVYFFKVRAPATSGSWGDVLLERQGVPMEVFDLGTGEEVDYYSLPNLIQTLKAERYGFLDEIMATPLVTLEQAFAPKLS